MMDDHWKQNSTKHKPQFEPYIGSEYPNPGSNQEKGISFKKKEVPSQNRVNNGEEYLKILFIGGFHYCFPSEYGCDVKSDVNGYLDCLLNKDSSCQVFIQQKDSLHNETQKAINDHINNQTKKDYYKYHVPTVHVFSSFYTFFNDFKEDLINPTKEEYKDDPTIIWKHVAFVNYIQQYILGRNFLTNYDFVQIPREKTKDFNKILRENIEQLTPDVIVVLAFEKICKLVKLALAQFTGVKYSYLPYLKKENVYYVFSRSGTYFEEQSKQKVFDFVSECMTILLGPQESVLESNKTKKASATVIAAPVCLAGEKKGYDRNMITEALSQIWKEKIDVRKVNKNISNLKVYDKQEYSASTKSQTLKFYNILKEHFDID